MRVSKNFIDELERETNIDYTENNALSKGTTLSPVLNFFSKSGALRGDSNTAVDLFMSAYGTDPVLARKALFYMRDVRGGQGERENFRKCLEYLVDFYPDDLKENLHLIPFYGRWDDLFVLFGSALEVEVFRLIRETLNEDLYSDHPSLLGKWMPSENASSKKTKDLARVLRNALGLPAREYRKVLSLLRKKIRVVERDMASKNWREIEYSRVPSKAMMRYKKAFFKHDAVRFAQFIHDVEEGKSTIKSGTLYPYELVNNILAEGEHNRVLEEQWKALPDWMNGEDSIAVVDTSGSMTHGVSKFFRPIDVSVSLGLYFAERNKGAFRNQFITFSESPTVQRIHGSTLFEKVHNLRNASWGYNTDLVKVFKALLSTAKRIDASAGDMPKKVYIISDMQFDQACDNNDKTNFQVIDEMYREAGYRRPELVFWNVNASSDYPVEKDETGTYLVSGLSPSILKYAMKAEQTTPEQFMIDVLMSERYKHVK